jgi:hypothetical protein
MARLLQKDIKIGMSVWCADYDYTTSGTRCTLNVEPKQYKITQDSAYDWYRIKGKNIKSEKETYLPTSWVFDTREEAEAHYKTCVCNHVKHLLDKVSYFSTIGVMSKRLKKYGLSELDRELRDISALAEAITKKLDNNA